MSIIVVTRRSRQMLVGGNAALMASGGRYAELFAVVAAGYR